MSEATVDKYALGRSSGETERLIWSAKQLRLPITRFLEDAGIETGMKVLDVGCGAGDVSLLAAEMVGSSGSVVGIDLNAAILDTARVRASEAGRSNISFMSKRIPKDLDGLDTDFDAVIGRRVLCYISSPTEALRALLTHLRPGGVVAFQEIDWTVWGWHSSPAVASGDEAWDWIYRAFEAGGTDMAMGTRLFEVFLEAGLPEPAMKAEAGVGSAVQAMEFTSRLLHSLKDTIVRERIANSDFDPGAVICKITEELQAARSVVVGGFEVSAWAKKA